MEEGKLLSVSRLVQGLPFLSSSPSLKKRILDKPVCEAYLKSKIIVEPQPTFSLWTPISFDEAESPNDERRIRLKKRPNQMYYLENRARHGKGGFSPKVCT